jgi:hypothetical protein
MTTFGRFDDAAREYVITRPDTPLRKSGGVQGRLTSLVVDGQRIDGNLVPPAAPDGGGGDSGPDLID